MRTEIVTPPTEEPVSLAEAKVHLRLPDEEHPEDDLVAMLIAVARERIEAAVSRRLVTQTVDLFLDAFPFGGGFYLRSIRERGWGPDYLPRCQVIAIPDPPLQSITSVKYLDADGVLQTLDPSAYRWKASTRAPGRVEPALNGSWPTAADLFDAVQVRYVAGYGAASAVPKSAKAAILLLVGHLYENREEVVTGTIATELPDGFKRVLDPLRWGRYS